MHNEANVVRLLASSVSASSNLPGILHPQDWKQNGHPPAAMADLAKLSSMAAMAPDMLGAINMLPDCVVSVETPPLCFTHSTRANHWGKEIGGHQRNSQERL